eukprot:339755-Rhodomonas_salina.2
MSRAVLSTFRVWASGRGSRAESIAPRCTLSWEWSVCVWIPKCVCVDTHGHGRELAGHRHAQMGAGCPQRQR